MRPLAGVRFRFALCLLAWAASAAPAAGAALGVAVSPPDGARYVPAASGLIVRPGGLVIPSSVPADRAFTVVGSRSGPHAGRAILSDDRRAIIWKGDAPFAGGETVDWSLASGARLESGEAVPAARGSFRVAESRPALPRPIDAASLVRGEMERSGAAEAGAAPPLPWDPVAAGWSLAPRADSLPPDFPAIRRLVNGTATPGRIFLANFTFDDPEYPSYLMILEDDGTPVFYRRLNGWGLDFKMQPDGRLTYFDNAAGKYYALDSTYAVVDSFACGNGYSTDLHELRVLPDDHALLLSYDAEPVDMSAVVPGGDSSAVVVGLVLQEIDRNKNVVFEWRSWDHFQITDATYTDFTQPVVDYVHGNAVEVDTDGNLLLSSRHMDEITKIDRDTGDVIWRLGGKHNQFAFPNDSAGFSHQHAVRRIANGDLTIFDNGNYHEPFYSRAVEYRLDEAAKTATLVWQYRNLPDIGAFAMGYVQRFDDGNTLIGWGSANPTVTEVNAAGEQVAGLSFDPGMVSYRAYRFPWYPERAADAGTASKAAEFRAPRSHPFRKSGTLTVAVHRRAAVTVRLFDAQGRMVRVLLYREPLDPGDHDVPLDAAGLPSGVYYCRVRALGMSDTRRIVFFR